MDSSDAGPTEDTILALLDYLVDPMLPGKSSMHDTPLLSQQQSVAKQVHAVVLLYNYYHRKQQPQQEFLGFESFCKLAVVLKPTFIAHLKLMQQSYSNKLDDLESQLSVTEKTIMNACDISLSLDASKTVPNTNGWPISKISVFLIDSKKENCLLVFNSITQGVWSVIEKDIGNCSHSSEIMAEAKLINKKKRITKRLSRDESSIDETGFQKLAFSAVKEATGINQTDLLVLESHVTYSLSKEKTAAHFYIMQCIQSINEEAIQVPISDAIASLHGPLVKLSLCGWTVTPVVEYFHMLPYAGILSDWFSRNFDLAEHVSKTSEPISDSSKQAENQVSCLDGSSVAFCKPDNMNMEDSCVSFQENAKIDDDILNTVQANNHPKQTATAAKNDLNASESAANAKVEMVESLMLPCVTDCISEKFSSGNTVPKSLSPVEDVNPTRDCAVITCQSTNGYHDEPKVTMARNDNILSHAALRVLFRKRDKLSLKQRIIDDEIAQCDKTIQTILAGGEDNLELKIESIIEGYSKVCLRSAAQIQDRTRQLSEDQCSPLYFKRKRLSEAILTVQNTCQELDGICYENNWILPTYRVTSTDGGFQAEVSVKGMDFEYLSQGSVCAYPHEARDTAATQMLAKLRSMAKLAP